MKFLRLRKSFYLKILFIPIVIAVFLYIEPIKAYIHKNFQYFLKEINFTLEKITFDQNVRYCIDFESLNMFDSELKKPIFYIDTDKIEGVFQHIDCVKDYKITRILPNTMKITIQEKQPLAIWQDASDRFFYVTGNNNIITIKNPKYVDDFIIFTGNNAYKNVENILDIVKLDKNIEQKITSINYISERRWDINLDNNIKIMLPEENPEIAWKKFIELEQTNNLSSKKNKRFDFRIEDKLIVGRNQA